MLDANGQGACFLDCDSDGHLDVYLANGSSRIPDSAGTAPAGYLLRNGGDGTLSDGTEEASLGDTSCSSGCAVGDFDSDGDVDFPVVNKNDRPAFLLNDGGNRRNWLEIGTQGGTSDRDGIGAKAVVAAEGQRRFFEIRGSDSYLSSNDMRIHVGLGESTFASVTIRWPPGVEDGHEGVAAGSFYRAAKGQELEETLKPGSGVGRQCPIVLRGDRPRRERVVSRPRLATKLREGIARERTTISGSIAPS